MSLYGALFSGVSGLKAQSNKLASISDNISNVNTIGYKANQGIFQTLVTSAAGGTAYSPGGVLGANRQLVSQQGLLQATASATDIAISGGGFFVVNQTADGTGQVLYTRSGSFTQDSTGNFRNTSGFFLQAWPLDREGRLPGEPGNENTISSANLTSLRTVNVTSLTGVAAATTAVTLSANLKSSETIFPGAGATVTMNADDSVNAENSATDLIIPQGSADDYLTRGDAFNISTGGGASYTFTYGGYTVGRSITSGAGGDHGSSVLGSSSGGETTLLATPFSVTNGDQTVVVTHASHGLADGEVVDLSGNAAAVGGIPAADFNGTFVITYINANSYSIEVADAATSTTTGGTTGVTADVRVFADAGEILDADDANQSFLSETTTTPFSTEALSFSISNSTETFTFTYQGSSPDEEAGQFNTLNSLVEAINATDVLVARVSGGRLYVSAIDATDELVFENGLAEGTEGDDAGEALYGIDWVRELGLADVAADTDRFSTLQGLADLVNNTAELTAEITSPLADTEIEIRVDDPLDTITFTDEDYDGSPNTGSVLAALGLIDTFAGTAPTGSGDTTGALGPAYDPDDADANMAGGAIAPQFSRPVRIYDAQGFGHDLSISFIKTAVNTWAVEVYAIDATEVTTTNGLLASGTVVFNGDASLQSVTSGLSQPIDIAWTNGASDSEITFNWGTEGAIGEGDTDGLSQFASAYKVNFANQNGAQVGELTGVTIDENGFVTASYSNGETQRLFKLPIADFANPDQLQSLSGNVFNQSSASGEVNLAQAGSSGVGKFAPSSLEASNVELADQLTDMIVAQRAYQANTKIISTSADLLRELNDVLR